MKKSGIKLSKLIAAVLASSSLVGFAGMNVLIESKDAKEVSPPMRHVVGGGQADGSAKLIPGAAGNAYLEIAQGAGKPPDVQGGALFEFTVDTKDTYYLWARVWWLDGCGNSLGMSINGEKEFTFGQDATYKQWHWVRAPLRLSQLDLNAGKHTLRLSNREDGVAVDQILITRNKRYVPVGIEKAD